MKAKIDFTARLGKERKKKLERIAKNNNRSMAGQVCQMIDEAEENEERNETK